MARHEIICADVIKWAETYDGPPAHAMICDPPYEMSFMNRRWDGTGISFQPDTWAALAEHLLPGAFIMAFAGARTYHRLAVALEDAGLRIHPAFGWLQSQGFPKSTRIDTQIDKAAGKLDEREVVGNWKPQGTARPAKGSKGHHAKMTTSAMDSIDYEDVTLDITTPATDLARAWEGHRYGLQCIKPSLEFIALAQKPYEGKPVDCIVETGAGALWVDGGRIGTNKRVPTSISKQKTDGIYGKYKKGGIAEGDGFNPNVGRWPSNFCLSHVPPDADGNGGCVRIGTKRVKGITGGTKPTTQSIGGRGTYCGGDIRGRFHHADADGLETVDAWRCELQCPIRKIGEQSGERASFKGFKPGAERKVSKGKGGYHGSFPDALTSSGHNDWGTCARFFKNCDWSYEVAERLAESDPVRYQAKASRSERDAGLESLQPVGYNKAKTGGKQWESAEKSQATQAEEEPPQRRDTIDLPSGIQKQSQQGVSLPMSGSGRKPMGQSLKDTASTTLTGISKTTDLKTLSLLTSRPISDSIAGASSETESGGNLVSPVEDSSQLTKSIGISQKRDGLNMGDAENAISEKLSATNVNAKHDKRPKEAANRVGIRNPHPT